VSPAEYNGPTGKVKVSGCLGTDASISEVNRQRTCGGLKTKPTKTGDKTADKIFVKFDRIR